MPHLRCSASYIPRTQRLPAGLTYAAPPALQKREGGASPAPTRHGLRHSQEWLRHENAQQGPLAALLLDPSTRSSSAGGASPFSPAR